MNILSLGRLAFGTFTSSLAMGTIVESKMKAYDTDVFRPIDTVSIVMSAYNEVPFIEQCLQSLINQSIILQYPEYFEILVADSCSTDGTIEKVLDFIKNNKNIDIRLIITPKGKLTSRNVAINESKGNIIVSADADTNYSAHWLNTILKPFKDDPSVVAVSGSTFDSAAGVPGPLFSLGDYLYNKFVDPHRMVGRNCAAMKHVHHLAGGFDESVNQFHIWSIFKEEEGLYGQRLSKFGKVVYKVSASCTHLGGSKSLNRIMNQNEYKRETF